ncbi:RNA-binding protein 25 isoform X1 [Vitis riparia]|uniref:RNA-binding protein 25 isoform X1 n=2 Tax=Vitis riparia TaxID=96939 RepID=UPI00155A3B4E|nr:RNA-binding protein 25 isoform X1 [Vitis riparia]
MADPSTTSATVEQNPQQSEPDNPSIQLDAPPAVTPSPSRTTTSLATPVTVNPNSNPQLMSSVPQPIQQFAPPPISSGGVVLPPAPSFRPAPPPVQMLAPQFSPVPNATLQNSNFQNPNVPPPGVSPVPVMMSYQIPPPGQPPNPALRPYAPVPNGYPAIPAPGPQGAVPPPGVPRYPSPYATMVRPAFPPRPPGAIGMLPALSRPPVPGMPGVRPIMPPVVRPAIVPVAAPTEKPQTTVYVGKIASTVENDFILSLLQVCGPVKSWKHAQYPIDGTPRGLGFCEFESPEGVLRALRLLTKFNVDGQELVLNVNQATREYLERYVEKKTENSKKPQESDIEGSEKEQESVPGVEQKEILKPSVEDSKKDGNELVNKENQDNASFGIVTDEDREADREALEKLTSMMEERIKTKPLPPPPAQGAAEGSENTNSELPTKSRDSDVDVMRNDAAEDDETTSENKPKSDQERLERSSPDRSRRYDRRSRERDRDRELKREKEREFDRLERERERERVRREKEREIKIERAENLYRERVKEWEYREREKEYQRQHEKEREKERERERRREISNQERDNDEDDSRKRRRRSSEVEEKRKKRQREKEEDLADRLKEVEEIAETNRRASEEEQQQQQEQQNNAVKLLALHATTGSEKEVLTDESDAQNKDKAVEQAYEGDSSHQNHIGDGILQNGTGDESAMASLAASDVRQSSNLPARKLGFGLVGSGKRTAVPSVFHEEEDDDAHKEKKMRPLVPIDYSTEELQAVQPTISGPSPSNLVAAAEFAKRITNVKDDKSDIEKERNRRAYDRSSHRDRNDEDINRARDENREKFLDRDRDREHGPEKLRTPDNKKLLDAKQLIDMIPKTKEELFSYEINWGVYDKHELHERMRPWISKKITEFLGEEEATLVDYIVSSTQEHVKASQMLELLQSILDDEAEMFVLKMWRMLIFEIKKVETGLSLRSKT